MAKNQTKQKGRKKAPAIPTMVVAANAAPAMVLEQFHKTVASTRRNSAATNPRTDQYKNIEDCPYPFKEMNRGAGHSSISIADMSELIQKAYFNFPVLRNVIDVMTEFSSGKIHIKGGNQKSRDFFKAYLKKINVWNFEDQFFREYYRSGNVFIYKFEVKVQPEDVRKIISVFGSERAMAAKGPKLPTRYVILNPADIEAQGTSSFVEGGYFKILNAYELERLKNPQTDEDKEFLASLPEEARKQIKEGSKNRFTVSDFYVPISADKLICVFYKKQDYEPFGVPMAWPVLKDLSAKEEMKQIDMAIARTMQQMVLLVTTGTEPEKGGVNAKHVESLKQLFENQSVGRVLVADYTTEASFVVPQISDILNPQKYEILENDINIGLNNIFTGGEKFANQSVKVEVFIERLKHGREAFLSQFLLPEIKRISDELGFRDIPTAEFEEFDLKDRGVMAKLYVELAKIGFLTPDETFKAFKTHELPDSENSFKNQLEFKDKKDKGVYAPSAPAGGAGGGAGRPSGSKSPKTVNTISPMGGQEGLGRSIYSAKAIKDNFIKATSLENEVIEYYKQSNKLRKLKAADELLVDQITKTIIANEEPDKWTESIAEYCENPVDKNKERLQRVCEIGAEHGVDFFLASVLLASEKK